MYVTLLGMVKEVKLLQPLKASLPIVVTLLGMVTEVKPQYLKAPSPMDVTQLGMIKEVKQLKPLKA
jgi:metal-sulfur cluster biosynthetic enzyme